MVIKAKTSDLKNILADKDSRKSLVEQIVERLWKIEKESENRISKKGLADTLIRYVGSTYNCYPGNLWSGCHLLAFFFALAGFRKVPGLMFYEAMEKLIAHCQGFCPEKNKYVLFIADHWEAETYQKWHYNISRIKEKITLDFWLITGHKVSLIEVD